MICRRRLHSSADCSARSNPLDNGVLTKDTVFSSPSAAAQFLMGTSSNGKLQWKSESGIPLGQLEQQELAK